MRTVTKIGLSVVLCLVAQVSSAYSASITTASLPSDAPVMETGSAARPPVGWVQFCRDNSKDCTFNATQDPVVALTPALWKKLQTVNEAVNDEIEPVTDQDHWGVPEVWSYPTDGKGDCEDYALLKRKRLLDLGFSRRAMLMTVVIDETGGGHAVLTVRTNKGDLVLDNKRNSIVSWADTGYQFVKRESQAQVGWVALGQGDRSVATATR